MAGLTLVKVRTQENHPSVWKSHCGRNVGGHISGLVSMTGRAVGIHLETTTVHPGGTLREQEEYK
jgi:hypothetical protein